MLSPWVMKGIFVEAVIELAVALICSYLLFFRKEKTRRNPIDWTAVDRSLALVTAGLEVDMLAKLTGFFILRNNLQSLQFINPQGLYIYVQLVRLFTFGAMALLLIGFRLRNRSPDSKPFSYAVVLYTAVGGSFIIYYFGTATHPTPWLGCLGMGAFILLLFDLIVAIWWLVAIIGLVIGASLATRFGALPYAPFWGKAPFGEWEINNLYLDYTLAPITIIFLLVFFFISIIVIRWRNREAQLADMTVQLNESLDNLRETQDQLVESEKMAALGGLVAGVAHEVNTPVGVAVTAASHLEEKMDRINRAYNAGLMKRSDLEIFLKTGAETAGMILSNLGRAADLVQSFKQVAVDQSSEEPRTFNIKKYLEDILLSLHPKLKKTRIKVEINCPDDLQLTSHPGAFSQIITNLVMNSITHAFDEDQPGNIEIDANRDNHVVRLRYSDNGRGMEEEQVKKIFDPFFTTRRGQGGTGLGMHVVFNLVTQTLGGRILCESAPGEGTTIMITIPVAEV